MSVNILICGIGGQGTVLAAKLLAQAAMLSDLSVHSAETIGMAQRGGSVISHVRIGDDCFSPLIPHGQAEMIIAFEMSEAVRNLPYLKAGGAVIVNKKIMMPSTPQPANIVTSEDALINILKENAGFVKIVDSEKICDELQSQKVVNTVLLGAAIRYGISSISKDMVEEAIRKTVKPAFVDLNIAALEKGGEV